MSDSYLMLNNSNPSVTDIIINGTLTTNDNELQSRSGGISATPDIFVGAGTGNSGILNVSSGGTIDLAGAATLLYIGSSTTDFSGDGYGVVNFFSGSVYQIQKGFIVNNGILNFETGVTMSSQPQDEADIGANGTLQFSGLSSGNASTLTLQDNLDVAAGATLRLDFLSAVAGETYTLLDSIDNAGTYNQFDNLTINGLDPSLTAQINYNNDSITVDILPIPEPSSTALIGLAGFGFLLRRKK